MSLKENYSVGLSGCECKHEPTIWLSSITDEIFIFMRYVYLSFVCVCMCVHEYRHAAMHSCTHLSKTTVFLH